MKGSPDMIERQAFVCPQCGGSTYGSHDANATGVPGTLTGSRGPMPIYGTPAAPAKLVRMCHDEHGIGCRFEWPAADDARYFRGTGAFFPRTVMGKP